MGFDLEVAEDEFHFLSHCLLCGDLRKHSFEKFRRRTPDLFWLSAIVLSWFFQEEIYSTPEPDSLKMHEGDNRKHCILSNITTFYYKICIF